MAAAWLSLIAASPAAACSFSWKPGWSPDEIKAREDVRMVRGTFHVVGTEGDANADGMLENGWIYGRLQTRRGTGWDTVQDYSLFAVECAAYRKPTSDARGVFWIERQRTDGRYKLLLWEGDYLPDGETGADPTDKREAH